MNELNKRSKPTMPVINPSNDLDEAGPIDVLSAASENIIDYTEDMPDMSAMTNNQGRGKVRGGGWLARSFIPLVALAIITGASWYLWSNPEYKLQNLIIANQESHNHTNGTNATTAFDFSKVPEERRAEALQLQQEITELQAKRQELLLQEERLARRLEELQQQIKAADPGT